MRVALIAMLPQLALIVSVLPILRTAAFPFPHLVPGKFANLLKGFGEELFGQPNAAVGELLANFKKTDDGPHPEEIGGYYQGDILFPIEKSQTRNGMKAESARWESAVVPYQIASGFSSKDKETLKKAMNEYHEKTCIRFTEKTKDDDDYIYITNEKTGCWSSVGRTGGKQQVNLQSPGCLGQLGTPVHELMHALGFFHEQNRYDRDDFVNINWSNIQNGKENNFDKVPDKTTTAFGVTYDYGSVMHYSGKAFSKNDKSTITPKKSNVNIGQRKGLSDGDIKKLKAMYKCDANGKSHLKG